MRIDRIDHLVLTVSDLEATCAFYRRALGLEVVRFGEGRVALAFGRQKINLHPAGSRIEPRARRPVPGSGDLCLVADATMDEVLAHLEAAGVAVLEGPVPRTGALGPFESVYLRDPDGNLVEVSVYP